MYKLPDGTEVDCTLVQARRVWEICKLHSHHVYRIEVLGDVIRIADPVRPCFVGKDASLTLTTMPYLIMQDGSVFNQNSRFCEPSPPMESEKSPEVSEFHRGVITAIETIWKRKFTTTHWTWETQDILARAAADGKINGLATLLEMIATTDMVEDALDALHKLTQTQTKPATEFTLNYCRGKLDAIKVVWADRFSRALLDEHLDILIDAMRKDVTSVDRFLKSLASGVGCAGLRAELDRLRSEN